MPRRRGSRGRPSLLDTKRREMLLLAMEQGDRLQVAALKAGISPITAEGWRRRGEGRDSERPNAPIYRKFARDIAHAEAIFESNQIAAITAQAPRDYNAAKFLLQARFPDVYGDKKGEAVAPPAAPSSPLIGSGQTFIFVTPADAERIGLDWIQAKRLTDGGSDPAVDLDELSVGPGSDQQ